MRFFPAALLFASSLGAQEGSGLDALPVSVAAAWDTVSHAPAAPTDSTVDSPDAKVEVPMSLTVPTDVDNRLFAAPVANVTPPQLSLGARPATGHHRGRYGGGFIGFVAGAAAGVGIAAAAGPYHCTCDDPGLDQAAIGIAVGGILGAGIGAALPGSDVPSPSCTLGARIGQGIFGSIAGGAVGVGIGALIDPLVAVFSVPFTAPLGASRILRHCN